MGFFSFSFYFSLRASSGKLGENAKSAILVRQRHTVQWTANGGRPSLLQDLSMRLIQYKEIVYNG